MPTFQSHDLGTLHWNASIAPPFAIYPESIWWEGAGAIPTGTGAPIPATADSAAEI